MTTKAKLSDAIRRGMQRNQERGLPINRWSQTPDQPQLSRFDGISWQLLGGVLGGSP